MKTLSRGDTILLALLHPEAQGLAAHKLVLFIQGETRKLLEQHPFPNKRYDSLADGHFLAAMGQTLEDLTSRGHIRMEDRKIYLTDAGRAHILQKPDGNLERQFEAAMRKHA